MQTTISRSSLWLPALALVFSLVATGGSGLEDDNDKDFRIRRLLRMLDAEDHSDRETACYELADLGPTAKQTTMPALLKVLHDDDEEVREAALEALISLGPDSSSIPHLVWVLNDLPCGIPSVGQAYISEKAYEALQAVGEPAIPTLVDLLLIPPCNGDTEWTSGGIPSMALGKLGPPALEAVLEALEDTRRREGAVEALGWMGSAMAPQTVPVLAKMVTDRDVRVRWAVARAIQRIGSAASFALPDILCLLDDADAYVVGSAVAALGAIGPDAAPAVPKLLEILKRVKDEVTPIPTRERVLSTLEAIGPPAASALPVVRSMLNHSDLRTRKAASSALKRIEVSDCPATRYPIR